MIDYKIIKYDDEDYFRIIQEFKFEQKQTKDVVVGTVHSLDQAIKVLKPLKKTSKYHGQRFIEDFASKRTGIEYLIF